MTKVSENVSVSVVLILTVNLLTIRKSALV